MYKVFLRRVIKVTQHVTFSKKKSKINMKHYNRPYPTSKGVLVTGLATGVLIKGKNKTLKNHLWMWQSCAPQFNYFMESNFRLSGHGSTYL